MQSDPRSPEHGQYGFLQDLVRHVAYETLSKRERKSRHLAAVEHLEQAFPDPDEVAEVLASHYLAAVEAAPEADDAPEIRVKPRDAGPGGGARRISRRGRGAALLRAGGGAHRRCAGAGCAARAGRLAVRAIRPVEARQRLQSAIDLFTAAGDPKGAARATVALADVEVSESRLDEALARFDGAVAELEQDLPSAELACCARPARPDPCAGRARRQPRFPRSSEPSRLPSGASCRRCSWKPSPVRRSCSSSMAASTRRASCSRPQRARLRRGALHERAPGREQPRRSFCSAADRYAETLEVATRCAILARRRGDRRWEWTLRVGSIVSLYILGALERGCRDRGEEIPAEVSEVSRAEYLTLRPDPLSAAATVVEGARGRRRVCRG